MKRSTDGGHRIKGNRSDALSDSDDWLDTSGDCAFRSIDHLVDEFETNESLG